MPTPADSPFQLSGHAAVAVRERSIDPRWIAQALSAPSRIESDRDDPALKHALATVPEYGDRVLRVVYNPTVSPPLIVTAFFDRSMKGKL